MSAVMEIESPTLEERLYEVSSGLHTGFERQVEAKAKGHCIRLTDTEIREMVHDFAIDAAYSYNAEKSASWSTYLRDYMHWKLYNWLRSNAKRPDLCASSMSIASGDCRKSDHSQGILQVGVSDPNLQSVEVQEIISRLHPKHQQIFHCLLDNGVPNVKVLGAQKISKVTGQSIHACRRFVTAVRRFDGDVYESE